MEKKKVMGGFLSDFGGVKMKTLTHRPETRYVCVIHVEWG